MNGDQDGLWGYQGGESLARAVRSLWGFLSGVKLQPSAPLCGICIEQGPPKPARVVGFMSPVLNPQHSTD